MSHERSVLIAEMIDYFEAIQWITDPRFGRNPNRARAIAGQIARTAIAELRTPRLVFPSREELPK